MKRNASSPFKCGFLADFSNAFNTVERNYFLRELRQHLPALSPWCEWAYSESSFLRFDDKTIKSERGAQQGDPLGPLLFAIALQPILRKLKDLREEDGNALEICFSYLDDCFFAGESTIVAKAVALLRDESARIGLHLDLVGDGSKCAIVPTTADNASIDRSLFPDGLKCLSKPHFKFLGSPIGDKDFCAGLTEKRKKKAQPLMEAIAELDDPQVSLQLLRSCASFGKIVFALKTTPFEMHKEALEDFDSAVRASFEDLSGLRPNSSQWEQATLAMRQGGIGLRRACRHASAAFCASAFACKEKCAELDSGYVWDVSADDSEIAQSVRLFNQQVAVTDQIDPAAESIKTQRDLSTALDKASMQSLISNGDLSHRCHYLLMQLDGSGSWLSALPNAHLGLQIKRQLFIILLQRRLRMQIFDRAFFCPFCDAAMDTYGDHALTCPCGGDRTKRHNQLRNHCARLAASAGMRPEVEKPGLLEQRMDMERLEQDPADAQRRPADIFLPCWHLGGAAALDFAVTSGMQTDCLRDSAADAGSAAIKYELKKKEYKETAAKCIEVGFQFVPMVCEAHSGSWGPEAKKIFKCLAKAAACNAGDEEDDKMQWTMQSISVVLHRENARAILRRFPPAAVAAAAVSCAAAEALPPSWR